MCDSRNYNPDNYIHVEIESNEDKDHKFQRDEGEEDAILDGDGGREATEAKM